MTKKVVSLQARKDKKMLWIGIIVVFGIIFFREERKKERDPNYHSWMDDVKPWDAWRRRGH